MKFNISNFIRFVVGRNYEPLDDRISNFSSHVRTAWVAEKASGLAQDARVLDAGAGECQYRGLFAHCVYRAQDFAQYEGTPSGLQTEHWNYGTLDYVCDIAAIPVPDGEFDAVLCTEVLEHLPDPVSALKEFSRLLSPGGRLFLTAPLSSGLHQQPYHFYGGFTPHFYRKFLADCGLEIVEIRPIGGLMLHVGQEVYRVGRILAERAPYRFRLILRYLFLDWIPRICAQLETEIFVEEFTVGYLVEARKPGSVGEVR